MSDLLLCGRPDMSLFKRPESRNATGLSDIFMPLVSWWSKILNRKDARLAFLNITAA